VDVPNQKMHLAPGMFANVVLQVENHSDALTIPVQALARDGSKSSVLVVDNQNRVEARELQTGLEDANAVEILSGVRQGDRVIVGNLGSYQPGQLVDPKLSSMANVTEAGGEQ
jgi:multidrug efflux pump subunit AcrA (membrane-fusion protein)